MEATLVCTKCDACEGFFPHPLRKDTCKRCGHSKAVHSSIDDIDPELAEEVRARVYLRTREDLKMMAPSDARKAKAADRAKLRKALLEAKRKLREDRAREKRHHNRLSLALRKLDFDAVLDILDEGIADVDHEDVYGSIPLIEACRNGFARLVEELFLRGADPNVRNKYGITPLIAAAKGGHADTIQVLLYDQFEDPRCDIHHRNRKSKPEPRMNAHDYALKAGHKKVAAMLATHMQKIPPLSDSDSDEESDDGDEDESTEGEGESEAMGSAGEQLIEEEEQDLVLGDEGDYFEDAHDHADESNDGGNREERESNSGSERKKLGFFERAFREIWLHPLVAMNRRLKAARLVQNIVRRRLAHRAMKKNIRAKQEENRKAEIRLRKQNAYVLRIQRIARVLIARRRFFKMRERSRAALVIQRVYRGSTSRYKTSHKDDFRKWERLAMEATVRIQALLRRKMAQPVIQRLRRERLAAIRIQKTWRKAHAQEEIKKRRWLKVSMAIMPELVAATRALDALAKILWMQNQVVAADTIHFHFAKVAKKMYKDRTFLQNTQAAALIQRVYRGHRGRKRAKLYRGIHARHIGMLEDCLSVRGMVAIGGREQIGNPVHYGYCGKEGCNCVRFTSSRGARNICTCGHYISNHAYKAFKDDTEQDLYLPGAKRVHLSRQFHNKLGFVTNHDLNKALSAIKPQHRARGTISAFAKSLIKEERDAKRLVRDAHKLEQAKKATRHKFQKDGSRLKREAEMLAERRRIDSLNKQRDKLAKERYRAKVAEEKRKRLEAERIQKAVVRERAQLRQTELQKRKLDKEMDVLERQQAARMEREHRAEIWRKVKHKKKLVEIKRAQEAAAKVAKFRRIKLGLEEFSSSDDGSDFSSDDGNSNKGEEIRDDDDDVLMADHGHNLDANAYKHNGTEAIGKNLDDHIRVRVQNEISARVNTIVLNRMERTLQDEAEQKEKKLARERRYGGRKRSNSRGRTSSRSRLRTSSRERESDDSKRHSHSARRSPGSRKSRRRRRRGALGRGEGETEDGDGDDAGVENLDRDLDRQYNESSFIVKPRSSDMASLRSGLFPRGPLPSRESAYGDTGVDRESLTRERERLRGLSRESAYGPTTPELPPLARPSSTTSDVGSSSLRRARSRGQSGRESTSAAGVRSRAGSPSGRPRSRAAIAPVLHFVTTEGVDDETASAFPAAIHVTSSPFTIGRSSTCDATLDSVLYPKMLSKHHATLYIQRDGRSGCTVEISDKNSTNGTFCSGERVRSLRRRIQNGELIRFGHQGNVTQPRSEVVYMLQIPTAMAATVAQDSASLGSSAYKPPQQLLTEVATIRPMSRHNPQRAALTMLSEMFPTDVPWVVEHTHVHAHDFLPTRKSNLKL